jgi:hypothetical protein
VPYSTVCFKYFATTTVQTPKWKAYVTCNWQTAANNLTNLRVKYEINAAFYTRVYITSMLTRFDMIVSCSGRSAVKLIVMQCTRLFLKQMLSKFTAVTTYNYKTFKQQYIKFPQKWTCNNEPIIKTLLMSRCHAAAIFCDISTNYISIVTLLVVSCNVSWLPSRRLRLQFFTVVSVLYFIHFQSTVK